MGNGYKQLCWECSKACNSNLCVWVASLKVKPKGCVIDKQGYIIECPNFESDKGVYTKEDYIKSLGLTFKEYKKIYYAVLELLKKDIKATIIECINFMRQTGATHNDYSLIKRNLKKYNLEYIPIVYVFETIKKRNITLKIFIQSCKDKPITKQEMKAVNNFLQQEEIKVIERRKQKENIEAKKQMFFQSYLGKDCTSIYLKNNQSENKNISYIKSKKQKQVKSKKRQKTKIDMFCQEYGITRETYNRIMYLKKDHRKLGITTSHEECINFIKNTNSDYKTYFLVKREIYRNKFNILPVDYYKNKLIQN